ncbi:MAG: hypothetical protein HY840_05815 [Bacteroidetes bacterium]|nr:hypothetical protein [Bacteroidota bacterium]
MQSKEVKLFYKHEMIKVYNRNLEVFQQYQNIISLILDEQIKSKFIRHKEYDSSKFLLHWIKFEQLKMKLPKILFDALDTIHTMKDNGDENVLALDNELKKIITEAKKICEPYKL